jgi:hypothetical protein
MVIYRPARSAGGCVCRSHRNGHCKRLAPRLVRVRVVATHQPIPRRGSSRRSVRGSYPTAEANAAAQRTKACPAFPPGLAAQAGFGFLDQIDQSSHATANPTPSSEPEAAGPRTQCERPHFGAEPRHAARHGRASPAHTRTAANICTIPQQTPPGRPTAGISRAAPSPAR